LPVSSFVNFLQWIQDSDLSTSFRESTYVWGVVDGIHVIGLCIFMGMLLFWELRLFNVGVRTATPAPTRGRPPTACSPRPRQRAATAAPRPTPPPGAGPRR